jgi:hypothetical protein
LEVFAILLDRKKKKKKKKKKTLRVGTFFIPRAIGWLFAETHVVYEVNTARAVPSCSAPLLYSWSLLYAIIVFFLASRRRLPSATACASFGGNKNVFPLYTPEFWILPDAPEGLDEGM